MTDKPPGCAGCSFERLGQGYVPGEGPADARVACIGQGPGGNEVLMGRPFFDAPYRAGRILSNWINYAGPPLSPRSGLWIDNATHCRILRAGKDVSPPAAVAQCYQRHWGPSLAAMPNLEVVVSLGTAASTFLMGPWARLGAAGSFTVGELPPLEPKCASSPAEPAAPTPASPSATATSS